MIAMSSADGSPSKTARKMNGTSSNVRDRAASIGKDFVWSGAAKVCFSPLR